jgi:hypothetical protein
MSSFSSATTLENRFRPYSEKAVTRSKPVSLSWLAVRGRSIPRLGRTQRRRFWARWKYCRQQILVSTRIPRNIAEVYVIRAQQRRRRSFSPSVASKNRNEFAMVLFCENLGGHNVPLVADATGAIVRLCFIFGSANDDDVVALPYFTFHEIRQLVARNGMPQVQTGVDPVSPQLSGKLSDPLLVRFVLPGLGDEDCRMAWHGVMDRRFWIHPVCSLSSLIFARCARDAYVRSRQLPRVQSGPLRSSSNSDHLR